MAEDDGPRDQLMASHPATTHDRRRALIQRLATTLTEAQHERPNRSGLTASGEPEWVAFELEAMTAETNRARVELGRSPVSLASVARVERQAQGHTDYVTKFALYCAEIALGERS